MIKLIKKFLTPIIVFAGIFAVAGFVFAGSPDLGLSYGNATGLAQLDPRIVVGNIIRIALAFLGIIAVALNIYAGYMWMTAAGNADKIDTAKKILVSAAIGLIIILSAFGIASYVINQILQATGSGSGEGGPCSTDVNSCVPSSALCLSGLTCGADCACHGGVVPPTPPGPGANCDNNSLTPTCEPGNCLAGNFCNPLASGPYAACTCQPVVSPGANCNASSSPAVCIDNGSCAGDPTLFCNPIANPPYGACTCQVGTGVNVPCNATSTPGVCSADTGLCPNELTCETVGANACTCQTYPVIDWISPIGGFCSDTRLTCKSDADCPGSTCDTISPNAAPGNIISIGGKYFGNTPGRVNFYNGSSFALAGIDPSTVNPNCVSWTDTQITIIVPTSAALQSGPVQVVRASDNKTDETNAGAGPLVGDLQINSIVRPGLCQVDKVNVNTGDSLYYYGIKFAGAQANFGTYQQPVEGLNSVFNPQDGYTVVPNLVSGKTTTFVYNAATGQPSNYLAVSKAVESNLGLFISKIEPDSGAPGQYVTIHGNGFGAAQGTSMVYFGSVLDGNKADLIFPDVCADSVWSDKQVIVKVPATLANGNYRLTIKTSAATVASDQSFVVDSSLSLKPSACKISPIMGQAGTIVSIWGEFFDTYNKAGVGTSRVRFSSNQNVTISSAANWDIDSEASGEIKPFKVSATVPANAASGPVSVVKGSPESVGNGLNFSIGSCLSSPNPATACGPDKCCPAGSAQEGRCILATADCSGAIDTSAYEFAFNTSIASDPGTRFGSCQEKSAQSNSCVLGACPNSPGLCSLFEGVATLQPTGVACDFTCSSKPGCASGVCKYSDSLNKCIDINDRSCGMASSTKNFQNNTVNTFCASYTNAGLTRTAYVFDNSSQGACPDKYPLNSVIMIDGKNYFVCINPNSSCDLCSAGQKCIDDGNPGNLLNFVGVCGLNDIICSDNSKCQNDNQCKKAPTTSCSCCCRKANPEQDCCSGLTCAGACGSNTDPDGGDFGSCSGCRKDLDNNGSISPAEQIASDAACNCTGAVNASGKFCDVSDGKSGVCRDCAALGDDKNSCSDHSGSCCVNAMKGDSCVNLTFGSKSSDVFSLAPVNGIQYCGFFQCGNNNAACVNTPVAKPTNSYFASSTECASKCQPQAPLGLSCQGTNTCLLNSCAPFSCLLGTAEVPSPAVGCGVCCCDPLKTSSVKTAQDYDSCRDLGDVSNPLTCNADKTPCSGDNRGLCCGCQKQVDGVVDQAASNARCVPVGMSPTTQGCGADSCCHVRPEVAETVPADDAQGVCTNAEIRVKFNQKMNTTSFNGNVVVVEETIGACPPGTTLALFGHEWKDKSVFSRGLSRVKYFVSRNMSWLTGKESLASEAPNASFSYCVIAGDIGSEQNGESNTVMTFSPHSLMKAYTKYFVIVQGDPGLNNAQTSVRSMWDIGLNVPSSPVVNTSAFNAKVFPGAYIWSFRTLPDTNENKKGICGIETVKIIPGSYLFQTLVNDLNENDVDQSIDSFDTVKDNDKVFTAQALSKTKQVLHGVNGYSWVWNWSIYNTNVANLVSGVTYKATDQSSQMIRASAAITGTDKKETVAEAQVSLLPVAVPLSTMGNGLIASTTIHVFICAIPWPAANPADGSWRPWFDNPDASSCILGANSTCGQMNYALYYCRDAGLGSSLPAVSGNTSRGSNLGCTDTSAQAGVCDGQLPGSSCGSNGTCQNLIKESYFFSE